MFVFGPVCVCLGFRVWFVSVYIYIYVCMCVVCVYLTTPVFMHAFARASVCADAI